MMWLDLFLAFLWFGNFVGTVCGVFKPNKIGTAMLTFLLFFIYLMDFIEVATK